MKIDRALAVIQSMASRRQKGRGQPSRALTYQPATPPVGRIWTWENATPYERACFVRKNREVGIMDWDLLELFNLTRDGLSEIVKGKDWHPSHCP